MNISEVSVSMSCSESEVNLIHKRGEIEKKDLFCFKNQKILFTGFIKNI